MKVGLFFIILALSLHQLAAQKKCSSLLYQQERSRENPSLAENITRIESFIQQQLLAARNEGTESPAETVIRIPVVIHNLYHLKSEKITDEQVATQIAVLNQCFRRRSADTINTPSYFKSLAADCHIEFQLAISAPGRRSTSE